MYAEKNYKKFYIKKIIVILLALYTLICELCKLSTKI